MIHMLYDADSLEASSSLCWALQTIFSARRSPTTSQCPFRQVHKPFACSTDAHQRIMLPENKVLQQVTWHRVLTTMSMSHCRILASAAHFPEGH